MSRGKYINKFIKGKYDRIEILLPKGQKNILISLCSNLDISISEYIRTLIANDLSGNRSTLLSNDSVEMVDISLLNKWQIPKKYRIMIKAAKYSKENGYIIELKDGYINNITNTKIIHVRKLDELRLAINKSKKI